MVRILTGLAGAIVCAAIGAAGCTQGSHAEESGRPAAGARVETGALSVSRLRCEYLVDPEGIDTPAPRLSWIVASEQRGQKQSAYRVLVASSLAVLEEGKADLFDSGRVASDRTTHMAYAGRPLTSGLRCVWKVRVWDRQGRPSAWSAPASWSMGLLDPSDWKAEWISCAADGSFTATPKTMVLPPARHYRKTFRAPAAVRRATLYATALGVYECHINGRPVSDWMFTPGWSDYHRRAYYNTFDVTALVSEGENALGATVADGWYSGYLGYGLLVGYGPERSGRAIYGKTPAFLCQLHIEFEDGATQTVITDASWKVAAGPFLEADMLMGEVYDARREMPGWDAPGFDDSGWEPAVPARDNPSVPATFHDQAGSRKVDLGFKAPPVMQAYLSVPVRAVEELAAKRITEPSPGVYIFDTADSMPWNCKRTMARVAGS